MGTKNVGSTVLGILLQEPKTFTELKKSLRTSGLECSDKELEKSLLRLSTRGFLRIVKDEPVNLYVLTPLGQAVSEKTKN